MEDGCFKLGPEEFVIDELLETASDSIVLLNKSDLLPSQQLANQKVILQSGKKLDASLVSFKSNQTDRNLDIIQTKLKSVL